MTFLILLIAFMIERFWPKIGRVRQWRFLSGYSRWFDTATASMPFKRQFFGYFLVVLSLLVFVTIVEGILSTVVSGVWLQLFNCLLLLYCLGPGSFYEPPHQPAESLPVDEMSAQSEAPSLAVFDVESQSMRANRTLFAPFFWFALLGVFGALLYRVTEQLPKNSVVTRVLDLLDWVPVRLLGFTFALVSYFVTVFPIWFKYLGHKPQDNGLLLLNCAKGSLSEDKNQAHLVALLDRSLIVWLVVLALIVLI